MRTPDRERSRSSPLVTQLVAPHPPRGHVRRSRLRERLARGTQEAATLVCGPPGSGKTALLSAWTASEEPPGPVAWVSLEPGDDDPYRLWDAILTSLRRLDLVPPDSPVAALAPPVGCSRQAFLPLLVNSLAELPRPVVLVLDDLHVLHSKECLGQLSFLLQHMPDTLRVVLSARSDPALGLHQLRVRERLTEIRAADLAFTRAEAVELLAAHGLTLDDALVDALCARTEGWAAGLRLAALSLQGRSDPAAFVAEFAGDDRVVADYLVAEVLDRQPPRRRAFLLRTSIVERLCGDLADAITGDERGADKLAELERTNAFVVSLDTHGGWYRYHGLFAELLRVRAARELRGEVRELHRRAARWYADNEASWKALRHAVAGEDWDLAVELVAAHWFELLVRGQGPSMQTLIARLPGERVAADAELSAAAACNFFDAGEPEEAERHLEHAASAADALPPTRRRRYLETVALARLYAARFEGDLDGAIAAADELLSEAAREDGWSGAAREALIHANLGVTAHWAHGFERAAAELQRAAELARVEGLDYVALLAVGHLALLASMRDGPAQAAPLALEAITLAARRGWLETHHAAPGHLAAAVAAVCELRVEEVQRHLARARAAASGSEERQLHLAIAHLTAYDLVARGRSAEGLREVDASEARYGGSQTAVFQPAATWLLRARVRIAEGDLAAARDALAAARRQRPQLAETDETEARLRLAEGDPGGAFELLSAIRAPAVFGSTRVVVPVLQAVALDELDEPAVAGEALERALGEAEVTGHRSVFLLGGRRMQALLRHQIRRGTAHRAVIAELLDVFADREPARRVVAPLLEPLSDREQAVLRYLPTPLSNREIAAELFVTTNTVKTHLRSIYRKLDVARRREAVERARDLRLLSTASRL